MIQADGTANGTIQTVKRAHLYKLSFVCTIGFKISHKDIIA